MGILLETLLLSLSSCNHTQPIPKWNAEEHGGLWAGSSKDMGLVRKQKNQVCKADQPCINNKIAFTDEGLQSFYDTFVLGCKQWDSKVPMEGLDQAISRLHIQGAIK